MERAHVPGAQSSEVTLKHPWRGDRGPQAKGSHLETLQPPACTVALQAVARVLHGKGS